MVVMGWGQKSQQHHDRIVNSDIALSVKSQLLPNENPDHASTHNYVHKYGMYWNSDVPMKAHMAIADAHINVNHASVLKYRFLEQKYALSIHCNDEILKRSLVEALSETI